MIALQLPAKLSPAGGKGTDDFYFILRECDHTFRYDYYIQVCYL
jgi:hypothetical protein